MASDAGATPLVVHIAITNSGEDPDVEPNPAGFPLTQSLGRVTEGGLLRKLWQGRRGMCVVSGPQTMLEDVRRVAIDEVGFAQDKCHLLEA